MLKISKEPKVKFPVEIYLSDDDGNRNKHTFVVIAKRMDLKTEIDNMDRWKKVTKIVEENWDKDKFLAFADESIKFLQDTIIDWEGVYDSDNNILPYSPKKLKELCESIPDLCFQIGKSYQEYITSSDGTARRKN